MGKITKTITLKLAWAILGFVVLYVGASAFNLVPQSMKNFVAYLETNTLLFVVAICFLTSLYVYFRIKTRSKNYGETS